MYPEYEVKGRYKEKCVRSLLPKQLDKFTVFYTHAKLERSMMCVTKTKATTQVEIKNSLEVTSQNDTITHVDTIISIELVESFRNHNNSFEDVHLWEIHKVETSNIEDVDDEVQLSDDENDEDKEDESYNCYSN